MGDLMKKYSAILIAILLVSVIFVSGCVSQDAAPTNTIKSEQQVGEAVTDISNDVDDVSSILTDIDKKLG